jgi:hypothetical protein
MAAVTKAQDLDNLEEEPKKKPRRPRALSNAELEKLYYDSSARILQERNDFFLPQIRDFVSQKKWVISVGIDGTQ